MTQSKSARISGNGHNIRVCAAFLFITCMMISLLCTTVSATDVSSAAELAAALGGDGYCTVSGNTVTLTQNVTLTNTVYIKDGTITLDLAGYTITGPKGTEVSVGAISDYYKLCGQTAIEVNGYADFTLTGPGSIIGGEAIPGSRAADVWENYPCGGDAIVVVGGNAVINNVNFTGGKGAYCANIFKSGAGGNGITVRGGNFEINGGS